MEAEPSPQPRLQACNSCIFWKRSQAANDGTGWGQCRRMPPSVPEIGEDKLVHVGVWPHTDERDWCGEWRSA
jgi:hypothetical protein